MKGGVRGGGGGLLVPWSGFSLFWSLAAALLAQITWSSQSRAHTATKLHHVSMNSTNHPPPLPLTLRCTTSSPQGVIKAGEGRGGEERVVGLVGPLVHR